MNKVSFYYSNTMDSYLYIRAVDNRRFSIQNYKYYGGSF